jgi:hypothetical protein
MNNRINNILFVGILLFLIAFPRLVFPVPVPGAESEETTSVKASDPFSQKKFLPNISFILDFSFVRRDMEQDIFGALEIPGFIHGHSHDDGHSHEISNAEKGFNLNYGELVLSSAVDPYFDLFTAFHLSESSFEIEEAYIESRSLPYGLRIKLGKFLSSFGRLNSQHAHYWEFTDIPLLYKVFFGDHGLLEKGIQLNWTAPTNFFLGLGIEWLQGSNEMSFGTGEFSLIDAGTGEAVSPGKVPLPNTWICFGKTSIDVGDLVLLAGISYAAGKARIDHFSDEEDPHGFAGDSSILGLDFTAKYLLDSYRYIAFQGEYMYRRMEGTRFHISEREAARLVEQMDEHEEDGAYEVENAPMIKKQSGFYAQLVYRFHRWWRLGVRWDSLIKNRVFLDGTLTDLPGRFNRYGIMLDFSPTEFSRIRMQYNNNDHAFLEGKREKFHEFVLQFNFAIGAHGAHSF